MAAKDEASLLVQPDVDDAMPFGDVDELRSLVADARERGFATPEEIAAALEEQEPSPEQVSELYQYLSEQGIDVVSE